MLSLSQLLFCSISSHFSPEPAWILPQAAALQELPTPLWALHRLQLYFRADPPALTWCPPGLPCGYLVFSKSWGESLFQHWEHLLLSSSDLGLPFPVPYSFPLTWFKAVLSPSLNRLFLRHHEPGCGLSCALEWIHHGSWLEAAVSPFPIEATPAAPSPGAISTLPSLPKQSPRKEASPLPKPLCTVLPPISIQGSADVGEANAAQSHTYPGGTKTGFSSLVNAALSSTINVSLFSL